MFRLLCDAFHGAHQIAYFNGIAVFNYSCILRCVCAYIIALVKRRVLLEGNKTRRGVNTRDAKCLFQYHPVWSAVICSGWAAYISWCGTCLAVGFKDHGNHEAWLHSAIFMAGSSFYWEKSLLHLAEERIGYIYKIQEIIFHYSKFRSIVVLEFTIWYFTYCGSNKRNL